MAGGGTRRASPGLPGFTTVVAVLLLALVTLTLLIYAFAKLSVPVPGDCSLRVVAARAVASTLGWRVEATLVAPSGATVYSVWVASPYGTFAVNVSAPLRLPEGSSVTLVGYTQGPIEPPAVVIVEYSSCAGRLNASAPLTVEG